MENFCLPEDIYKLLDVSIQLNIKIRIPFVLYIDSDNSTILHIKDRLYMNRTAVNILKIRVLGINAQR